MVLQQLQIYVSVLRLQAMNLEHHKLQLWLAQACVNRAGHVKSSTSGHHECQSMSEMPKQLVKSTSESIEMYCSIGRQTNSHTDARLWHASCVLRNSYYVSCTKHDTSVHSSRMKCFLWFQFSLRTEPKTRRNPFLVTVTIWKLYKSTRRKYEDVWESKSKWEWLFAKSKWFCLCLKFSG